MDEQRLGHDEWARHARLDPAEEVWSVQGLEWASGTTNVSRAARRVVCKVDCSTPNVRLQPRTGFVLTKPQRFNPLAISSFRPTRLRVSHVHRDNSEPSRRRTVLIVDDDDEIRHSTRNLLGLSNFNVLLASDGVEALKVLERQHVDALVIDFMMPRLDGVGVVRALGEMPLQQRPPIIIVISLHYQLHARFVGLGVRRILPKPVDVPSLVQEIHAAFQEHTF